MLNDRKFYNRIGSNPVTQTSGRGTGRGGRAAGPWRPIVPDESVVMNAPV
jgi:hypothetical protein